MQSNKDLRFLRHFPHLTDWLNLNGYALIYSHRDEYDQIHTMWSDRTSAPIENGHTDARNWMSVVYCEHCNVIDVYKRVAVCTRGDDEQLVAQLEKVHDNICEDPVSDILVDDNENEW